MTFAIPYAEIKADMGILISASHNDYRYNGYKLSCGNGSQFDPRAAERDVQQVHRRTPRSSDIRLCPFHDAAPDKLVFLGGEEPVAGFDYCGREATSVMNIHREHGNHVKSFLLHQGPGRASSGARPIRCGSPTARSTGRAAGRCRGCWAKSASRPRTSRSSPTAA